MAMRVKVLTICIFLIVSGCKKDLAEVSQSHVYIILYNPTTVSQLTGTNQTYPSNIEEIIRNYTIEIFKEKSISEQRLKGIYTLGYTYTGFYAELTPMHIMELAEDQRISLIRKSEQVSIQLAQ